MINGQNATTPYGPIPLPQQQYTIAMPQSLLIGGITYIFQGWSDGTTNPARIIDFVSDSSLSANYLVAMHILAITSNPSGIAFTINQATAAGGGGGGGSSGLKILAVTLGTVQTPYSASLPEGSYVITMPQTVVIAGSTYQFQSWADGVSLLTRTINLTADTSLQANYVFVPPTNVLNVQSSPPAIMFTLDGMVEVTPFAGTLIDGTHTLAVPAILTSGGQSYSFQQWEDGSTNTTRTINLTADTTLTVTYVLTTFSLQITSTGLTAVPFTINGQAQVTPYSAILPPGNYAIGMPGSITLLPSSTSFGTWNFTGWTDAVTTALRTTMLSQNTSLNAIFQPLLSWNPNVPYTPVLTTIEQIIGAQINSNGGATLAGGWPWPMNPNGTDPNLCIKRQLKPPGSVMSIASVLGPTFVQINGVKMKGAVTEDCSTQFCTINGGSPYNVTNPSPLGCETAASFGDTVSNMETFAFSGLCNITDKTGCLHLIHTEFDHDWKAAGQLGPANNADWLSFSRLFASQQIDVQGFVYWDPFTSGDDWHNFSGWEIHPLTAWRLH